MKKESRLNLAVPAAGGFFPGDYYGLAAVGSDLVTTTTQVDQDNVTAIFFRRVSK
jgi:hypothetical protein